MRILWVCNIPLPEACTLLGLPAVQGGGWMAALAQRLLRTQGIILGVLFPADGCSAARVEGERAVYYPVGGGQDIDFAIRDFQPDLIHLHGTESALGCGVIQRFPDKRCVISVQGLVSIYALHFFAGLSLSERLTFTLRDLVRRDSMLSLHRRYVQQGETERTMLRGAKYVVGCTAWDRACVAAVSAGAEYLPCGEMLRDSFYNHVWGPDTCERHTIFAPSGSYPIKGLHMALRTLQSVLEKYPDTVLYVAGRDILKPSGPFSLGRTGYAKVIRRLIRRLKLEGHVRFTGTLDEAGMCGRYLSSHVFLLPSSIENSPNSLGEAMSLGLPCVAACVGGVQDLLPDRAAGRLYPFDEPYMAAFYISEIFENDALAMTLSSGARARAAVTYDRDAILARMLEIYNHMLKDGTS